MKNKKDYVGMKLRILQFDASDAVTTSGPGDSIFKGSFEREDFIKQDIFD